uniref:Uncharacterized protein n=1 Tax=Rhizophora mucronata TaxID=61149 RepID=A0A2P2JHU2_RHIMU
MDRVCALYRKCRYKLQTPYRGKIINISIVLLPNRHH